MVRNILRKLLTGISRPRPCGRPVQHFQPRLEALESRWVPSGATTRPISDFLSAQGTTSDFPNGINPGGPAGLPDELGWSTSTATFNNGTAVFARMDYTGQDAAFLGLNLGTTTSGTISERTLADGTAQDTVNLQTHNAFAWASKFDANNTVIFGFLPSQLAANPGLVPPVGNCNMQVVINVPHPGAPLPDIVVALNLGGVPGYTIESISFHATANGPTPTGQQATLVISEVGVLNRTPNLIRDFGFTVEVISVQTNQGTGAPAAASQTANVSSSSTSPSAASPAVVTDAVDSLFGNVLNSDPLASGF